MSEQRTQEEILKEYDPIRRQMLDDMFDAFSMLGQGNIVSLLDVTGGMTRYTKSAVDLFGLPGEYVPNGAMDWSDYVHPDDRAYYEKVMGELLVAGAKTYDLVYRVRTRDGGYIRFRLLGAILRNEEGLPHMIGGIMINQGLTENTDTVTVLRNQNGFLEDIAAWMKEGKTLSMLMTGISKLSDINQMKGYTYGNHVLQEVAWQIQESIAGKGSLYRMNGATFAIVSDVMTAEDLAKIYNSIRIKLQKGATVDGERQSLVGNGGVLTVEGGEMDERAVLSCLEYAYTESKERRHGDLVDYNGSLDSDAKRHLEMISAVRKSVLNGCTNFYIEYQPVYDAKTLEMKGAEALLRYEDERFGKVEPLEFLSVLEQDLVFEELGSWTLKQAMLDANKFLEKKPDFILGVNVSSVQVKDEFFLDSLFRMLDRTKFPAKNLCIEFTENCRGLSVGLLSGVVSSLKVKNIMTVLDDFGSGLDSLAFLRALSTDYVKLDIEFTENMERSESDRAAVQYLSSVAAAYGANVCAKGVETEGIKRIVDGFSVRRIQGNYLSVPVSAEKLAEML